MSSLIGLEKTLQELRDRGKDVQLASARAMKAAVEHIARQARINISKGTRTGRLYKRRTITHQASAPGEYPKTDTGDLVKSVFSGVTFNTPDQTVAEVGAIAKHAQYLEFKPAAAGGRRWLGRTMDEEKENTGKIIIEQLEKELNK